LGLALLAAILIGVFYFLDRSGVREAGPGTADRLISRIDRGSVNRIVFQNDQSRIVVEKGEEGRWQLIDPLVYPADEESLSLFFADLETGKALRSLTRDVSETPSRFEAGFGLENSQRRMLLNTADDSLEIILGKETVRGGQYYALVRTGGQSDWIIVDDTWDQTLKQPLSHWRSKRLVHFTISSLQGINLRHGAKEVQLQGQGKDWEITKPFGSPVNPVSLQGYLATLGGARIVRFIADGVGDLSGYGLNNPSLSLSFKGPEGETQLRLGNPLPEEPGLIYASTAPYSSVFAVKAPLKESLANLAEATRDRRIFPVNTVDEINRVEIEWGSGPLIAAVRHPDGSWHLDPGEAEKPQKADASLINDFLQTLVDARAQEFLPAGTESESSPDAEPEPVQAVIRVSTTAGDFRIETGSILDGAQQVVSDYLNFPMILKGRLDEDMPRTALDWYPHEVAWVRPNELTAIEWIFPERRLRVEKSGGDWLVEDEEGDLAVSFLERQIGLLESIRAVGRMPAREWDEDDMILTLILSSEEKTSRIEFAMGDSDGQVVAQREGDPIGFVLTENDYLVLETLPLQAAE